MKCLETSWNCTSFYSFYRKNWAKFAENCHLCKCLLLTCIHIRMISWTKRAQIWETVEQIPFTWQRRYQSASEARFTLDFVKFNIWLVQIHNYLPSWKKYFMHASEGFYPYKISTSFWRKMRTWICGSWNVFIMIDVDRLWYRTLLKNFCKLFVNIISVQEY